jgi:hypothetical protein
MTSWNLLTTAPYNQRFPSRVLLKLRKSASGSESEALVTALLDRLECVLPHERTDPAAEVVNITSVHCWKRLFRAQVTTCIGEPCRVIA